MPHDVFISYCSEDKKIADAVCATLEAANIRCWIAPRDVPPGANWGAALIDAINGARIMVIVFSSWTNKSPQVMREVERAVNAGTAIIPFRVEEVLPSKDIEFYISSCHWLDAMTPPFEQHLAKLCDAVNGLRGQPRSTAQPQPTSVGQRKSRALPWLGAGAALLLVAAVIFWRFFLAAGQSDTVQLESPPADATVVGPLLLAWSAKNLSPNNLVFELSVRRSDETPEVKRIARNSTLLTEAPGSLAWKVRPIWQQPGGQEKHGQWSEERALTYYPSALDRILATRTIHVGTGESDGLFVRNEGDQFTGFDIEMLRKIGAGILQAHQIAGDIHISYTYRVWGEEFFQLLEKDQAVDLIASGISITPQREQQYGIAFTKPVLQYPQTIVTVGATQPLAGGRLVLNRLAAVERTTSEALATQLIGAEAGNRLQLYRGSGAYDQMFTDLLAQRIDGILLDKPYALQKIAEFSKVRADFATVDVTSEIVPGLEPEQIGFAVRRADHRLLEEINSQLDLNKSEKRELVRRFFPKPEAFSPD